MFGMKQAAAAKAEWQTYIDYTDTFAASLAVAMGKRRRELSGDCPGCQHGRGAQHLHTGIDGCLGPLNRVAEDAPPSLTPEEFFGGAWPRVKKEQEELESFHKARRISGAAPLERNANRNRGLGQSAAQRVGDESDSVPSRRGKWSEVGGCFGARLQSAFTATPCPASGWATIVVVGARGLLHRARR